jgi:hypothetical protein
MKADPTTYIAGRLRTPNYLPSQWKQVVKALEQHNELKRMVDKMPEYMKDIVEGGGSFHSMSPLEVEAERLSLPSSVKTVSTLGKIPLSLFRYARKGMKTASTMLDFMTEKQKVGELYRRTGMDMDKLIKRYIK